MRPPDLVIGENYLSRWYVVPRNRWLNVYLHKFTGSDDDRALHDHPWHSVSVLLKGDLFEVYKMGAVHATRRIRRFLPIFRRASHAHRLVLGIDGDTWTLFITGPKVREWGFWCPNGWRHWSVFCSEDGTKVGRGCE